MLPVQQSCSVSLLPFALITLHPEPISLLLVTAAKQVEVILRV